MRIRIAPLALVLLCASSAQAQRPQFEALAASSEWLVVRENVPATAKDTSACTYGDLDPSRHVGIRVQFHRLSPEIRRGQAAPLGQPAATTVVAEAGRGDTDCTSAAAIQQRWNEVQARIQELGAVPAASTPGPSVLGTAVPARNCLLDGGTTRPASPCHRVLRASVQGTGFRIVLALSAVPQAPDPERCQFVGHRFVALIQVSGARFGQLGYPVPGGVVEHYDCRAQQFMPLRLYDFQDLAVLMGSFSGASIADHSEYPFVILFPPRPAR